MEEWKLIGHSHQIADTGDYNGYYEITNGKVSFFTNSDNDEALLPIVKALNDSGCKFYLDDAKEVELYLLKKEYTELKAKYKDSADSIYIKPTFNDYIEVNECPKCNSKNINWFLSSTKQCKDCGHVFRAEKIVSNNELDED